MTTPSARAGLPLPTGSEPITRTRRVAELNAVDAAFALQITPNAAFLQGRTAAAVAKNLIGISAADTVQVGDATLTTTSMGTSLILNQGSLQLVGAGTSIRGTTAGGYISIQPNTGGFFVVNNAGTFNNLVLTDAGAATFRTTVAAASLSTTSSITAGNGLTVTAGGLVVSAGGANITGTLVASAALTVSAGGASFVGTLGTTAVAADGANLTMSRAAGNFIYASNAAGTLNLGVVGSTSAISVATSGAVSVAVSLAVLAGGANVTGASSVTTTAGTIPLTLSGDINTHSLRVGSYTGLSATTGSAQIWLQSNAYWNGTNYTYVTSFTAAQIYLGSGAIALQVAPTGTGGATFAASVWVTGLSIAATTGAVTIPTTLTVSSLVTFGAANQAFGTANAGTAATYGTFTNSGGTLYVGIDSSTGGSLFASGAYCAGILAPVNFVVRIGGGTTGLAISSAGVVSTPLGLAHNGNLGFYGATPTTKPTVTGSRTTAAAALTSLIAALVGMGLINDSSTP